ncbi:MAG: N-acetylmuramoyl-L-alanine amidase [Gordonia sp. (in: high G+C Gram-positive bacteria)]|uniref:N-acetylmuramoyl-L-alanine amidase family protein n=1 Tax=Gordonia sp. (in: high G+C Gram-positive bacteria) TaxID=84139 RepID=UPI0039E3215D
MRRRTTAMIGSVVALAGVAGCASAKNVTPVTVTVFQTPRTPSTTAAPTPTAAGTSGCEKSPVLAIDPGHNPTEIDDYDTQTGVLMRDYPNGAEGQDVMDVATGVKNRLEKAGYTVVLLKKSVDESINYRDRVDRAEQAHADLAISLHTDIDNHKVFVQRVGLYREGAGQDGTEKRVTYTAAATAAKSQRMGEAFAAARSKVEGQPVVVTDNSFDGRAPLWGGNIPVIELISTKVPWVYNEFGTATAGGSEPIGDAGIATYTDSVVAGVRAALPKCR